MRLTIIIDQALTSVKAACDSRFALTRTSDIVRTIKDFLDKQGTKELGLVIFLSPPSVKKVTAFIRSHESKDVLYRLIVVADKKTGRFSVRSDAVAELRTGVVTRLEYQFIIQKSAAELKERFKKKREETGRYLALLDTNRDQEDLITIGRALSTEKNIDTLFRKILHLSQKITGADAGTIYIVEESGNGEKQIRVKYSDTFSRPISFEEAVLPYNTQTIAGYVAVSGTVLNIPDVYKLTPQDPVSFNPRFDKEHNYRTRSMLVVPMRNHFDEIIGVIQLINSKENYGLTSAEGRDPSAIKLEAPKDYDRYVVPFSKRYNRLLEAVAGQAAISIENARMIEQIKYQFEEFVKASVFAIESRDEATSGHSFRVAAMCLKLADAVNRAEHEPFRDVHFTEIERKELEYAALLHDYGKVYLDLRIFRKAKKLFPEDFESLMRKIDIAFHRAQIQYLIKEKEVLAGTETSDMKKIRLLELAQTKEECERRVRAMRDRICTLNEPAVIQENPRQLIDEIASAFASLECMDIDGNRLELFDQREKTSLEVTKGSLTGEERREIESHVEHTYNFVSKIPWPKELEHIPIIARSHHEFLDGSGYPQKLKGRDTIPLESRIMAIADIYDALTAHDRPYKKAMPTERALIILEQEVNAGKLDADLFGLFRQERAWEA